MEYGGFVGRGSDVKIEGLGKQNTENVESFRDDTHTQPNMAGWK